MNDSYEKLGGKIHKVMNETLYRALTVREYKHVTKMIQEVFRRAQISNPYWDK